MSEDTQLTVEDLTKISMDGDGAFDVMMRAVQAHLQNEHSASRITGDQYAEVYVTALTATMGQAVQFLLGLEGLKLNVEKNDAEVNLLKQKLATEKAQIMDSFLLDPTGDSESSAVVNEDEDLYYYNTVQTVEGVIGDKKDVLVRQTQGYDDDYKTKVARMFADAYKVMLSNIGNADDFPNQFKNDNVNDVMSAIKIDANLS